jgi:hypothetical protein
MAVPDVSIENCGVDGLTGLSLALCFESSIVSGPALDISVKDGILGSVAA